MAGGRVTEAQVPALADLAPRHRPRKLFEFVAANLRRYLRSETPRNVVDKSRGF